MNVVDKGGIQKKMSNIKDELDKWVPSESYFSDGLNIENVYSNIEEIIENDDFLIILSFVKSNNLTITQLCYQEFLKYTNQEIEVSICLKGILFYLNGENGLFQTITIFRYLPQLISLYLDLHMKKQDKYLLKTIIYDLAETTSSSFKIILNYDIIHSIIALFSKSLANGSLDVFLYFKIIIRYEFINTLVDKYSEIAMDFFEKVSSEMDEFPYIIHDGLLTMTKFFLIIYKDEFLPHIIDNDRILEAIDENFDTSWLVAILNCLDDYMVFPKQFFPPKFCKWLLININELEFQ